MCPRSDSQNEHNNINYEYGRDNGSEIIVGVKRLIFCLGLR